MIDTHSHIYLPEFDSDRDEVVERARAAGVNHIVLPNVDLTTVEPMYRLNDAYTDYTSVAMGLHPTEVDGDYEPALEAIASRLGERRFVAIGEIGIDMYWDKTHRAEQMDAFAEQINWAVERDLPVIIHCRDGLDEVLQVFDRFTRLPQGVFHSFGGTVDDVRRIRSYGDFYFGVNGVVTFKRSQVPAVLPEIGLGRILLETDAPYLAPVPHRGRRNESSYIPDIAACIATHLGVTAEEVSSTTDASARELFRLK